MSKYHHRALLFKKKNGELVSLKGTKSHLFTSFNPNQAPKLWWQVDEEFLAVWEQNLMDVFASGTQNSSELLTRLKFWNICENVGRYLLPSGHGLCVMA